MLFIFEIIENYKKLNYKKLIKPLIITVLTTFLAIGLYQGINNLHLTTVAEYEATVTFARQGINGSIYFQNTDGEERCVELADLDAIIAEDTIIEEGDTVHIKEMTGIFNAYHCELINYEKAN